MRCIIRYCLRSFFICQPIFPPVLNFKIRSASFVRPVLSWSAVSWSGMLGPFFWKVEYTWYNCIVNCVIYRKQFAVSQTSTILPNLLFFKPRPCWILRPGCFSGATYSDFWFMLTYKHCFLLPLITLWEHRLLWLRDGRYRVRCWDATLSWNSLLDSERAWGTYALGFCRSLEDLR